MFNGLKSEMMSSALLIFEIIIYKYGRLAHIDERSVNVIGPGTNFPQNDSGVVA